MDSIKIIERVQIADKWAEVWFEGGSPPERDFDDCCKAYMLWDVVSEAGMDDEILNTGFKGKRVEWTVGHDRPTKMFPETVTNGGE